MKNAIAAGQKTYLRPLEVLDAEECARWLNDPDVTRTLMTHRPMTVELEEEFIRRIARAPDELVLGIAVKSDDRLVGVCGAHHIDQKNRHAMFGITIGVKEEWGKGYGTEATLLMARYAFETMNLNRLQLQVHASNERAVKAYERVGYVREGLLRQYIFVEGRYHDVLSMAVLRDEWVAAQHRR